MANQELSGAFLQGHAGELLDAAVVLIVAIELQALYVVPVVDAMVHSGGNFGVVQFCAVEGGVYVGAQIGTEDREGFAVETASLDGLEERVDLKLGIEPAGLQAWPPAIVRRVLAGELGIGL